VILAAILVGVIALHNVDSNSRFVAEKRASATGKFAGGVRQLPLAPMRTPALPALRGRIE